MDSVSPLKQEKFMSTSLKLVLIVIAIGAVGGFYVLKQNEAQFQAEFSPHQDLSTLFNTGQVELKTFASWCKEQGHSGQALENCVAKRKAKAEKLLELERAAKVYPSSPQTDNQAEGAVPKPLVNGD